MTVGSALAAVIPFWMLFIGPRTQRPCLNNAAMRGGLVVEPQIGVSTKVQRRRITLHRRGASSEWQKLSLGGSSRSYLSGHPKARLPDCRGRLRTSGPFARSWTARPPSVVGTVLFIGWKAVFH
jgi:hypothetical protein